LEFLTSITIVAAAIALLTKDYITNIVKRIDPDVFRAAGNRRQNQCG